MNPTTDGLTGANPGQPGQPHRHLIIMTARADPQRSSQVVNHFHDAQVINNFNFVQPGQYNINFSGNPGFHGIAPPPGPATNLPLVPRPLQTRELANRGSIRAPSTVRVPTSNCPIHEVPVFPTDPFPHQIGSSHFGAAAAGESCEFSPKVGFPGFHLGRDGLFMEKSPKSSGPVGKRLKTKVN